ncbi:hypothetical protein DUI87_05599 [Hirundo rustica rustica]|uniref:Telomere length regulation protein TEL2 homolog n=1 Tax=Hirundo rustica rustica TaxID=333673 RepID=A0A3M0L4M7_HIRRU|nr:hypothetical protein DUI87_05599 [Hirundo rustica rustica]
MAPGQSGSPAEVAVSSLAVKEERDRKALKAPSPTKRKDRSEEKSKDRSKDKAATKESGEKDRGRDKTRKRRSASSGSSSTRSKPPKRDEKERKRRSPSPRPTKVHVGRLTRNVTKDHIMEIFSTYGKIKMIDMPVDRLNPHLSKGYAYVEFENPDDAEKALKHMDGGQIDGQEITATAVLAPRPRPPPRRFSPPRRMLPPPPMWRRSPPRMRRSSGLDSKDIVGVLEQFLQDGRVSALLWEVCQHQAQAGCPELQDTLLNKIVCLPEHVSNKLQGKNPPVFFPQNYFLLLGDAVLQVLEKISDSLRGGLDCSISFVSHVLGKVCFHGRQKEILGVLVPRLTDLTKSDCIWQRICWRLVECVPDRWMEAVVLGFVQRAPRADVLSRLLGNLVVKNKKAQFVVTQKMLLLQYGHTVLQELLETWSSSSAVKHAPIEQQLYISKAILICLSHLKESEIESCRQELLTSMMEGMKCHLDSSLPQLRRLGMVVAESISSKINTEGPVLKFEVKVSVKFMTGVLGLEEVKALNQMIQTIIAHFHLEIRRGSHTFKKEESLYIKTIACNSQYEEDDETRELKSLLVQTPSFCVVPSRPDDDWSEKADAALPLVPESDEKSHTAAPVVPDEESDVELDSDDDLIPYDMSEDKELKMKAPVYIRDCIEVLTGSRSEDVDKWEATVKALESLIRKNPAATREVKYYDLGYKRAVSVELAKILLHLEEKTCIEGFVELRQKAQVAVLTTDPIPVAKYLTSQFYSLNYSLRQRMDILDVLVLAAQELSCPKFSGKIKHSGAQKPRIQLLLESDSSKDWRRIVDERIKSKTRRFDTGQSHVELASCPNKFNSVAGYFFFPLIQHFDRPLTTFDLLGEDHLVLGRLVHTLAILMYLAVNTVEQLAPPTLCGASPNGMMECVMSLVGPNGPLSEDVPLEDGGVVKELTVAASFADVMEKDPDGDCRRLALQNLLLMENLKKKLAAVPS